MNLQRVKGFDRWAGPAVGRLLWPLRKTGLVGGGGRRTGEVAHIAAVKFWGLGNAALLLPVLRAVRESHPGARLSVVTHEANRSLLQREADTVYPVRLDSWSHCVRDLWAAARRLRKDPPDLGLDFEPYVRASEVLLGLGRARRIVGFARPGSRGPLLGSETVPLDRERHMIESFRSVAEAAGVSQSSVPPVWLEPIAEARARLELWWRSRGLPDAPLVVLHPGSGDNFPGRRWPAERFGALARRLTDETDALVAVTGSASERALVQEVVAASGRPLLVWSGRGIEDLVAFLGRARLLVANDTGPVHIASGLGVPVLGLFGPNTPRIFGPLSPGSEVFYDAPVCSPCLTEVNYKTSRCLNPVCIQAIQVGAVFRAAAARLAEAPPLRRTEIA